MTDFLDNIIALLTDFGAKGQHYVASMKGVILKINPNVKIIDISHEISSYSILEASYALKSTYKYFPKNTVFIYVIDPGVGDACRNVIAVKTNTPYYFVGPDNGILPNALEEDERIIECVKVENHNYLNKPISTTFHGRDIMAPIGAHITKGLSLKEFGNSLDPENLIKHQIEYQRISSKKFRCTVQYIDNFGNIITNIKGTSIFLKEGGNIKLIHKKAEYIGTHARTYNKVPKKSLLFLIGSTGFLEASINQGNAAKHMNLNVGDIIEIDL